jgi:hypothetical protein
LPLPHERDARAYTGGMSCFGTADTRGNAIFAVS